MHSISTTSGKSKGRKRRVRLDPSRLTCVLTLVMVLAVSVSMTSCGGGEATDADLVLVGFNLPNLSGIVLNNPLIFTFSAPVNVATITPDTLRVVGDLGPFFETTVVDGNLVALLPRSPNFEDYSDAGLYPDITYTVSLTTFPAVTTIESIAGKPLLEAESYTFVTQPFPVFIEPRRPIVHGTPWTLGGTSDDAGCLQNSGNALYVSPATDPSAIQTGSTPGAALLCLQNEGAPQVIEPSCIPRHDQQAVGSASPLVVGNVQIDAVRIRINENVDPLSVAPYIPTTQIPVNVQLWRVGLKDNSFTGPNRIQTNKPVVVQDLDQTEIILVPSGSIPQGVYCVNITPAVKDLPGFNLRFDDRPDPTIGGYDAYEAEPNFQLNIPPGYKIYFKTLEIPNTPLSIIEDFANNIAEWGDNDSAGFEPGINAMSVPDAQDALLDGDPLANTIASAAPVATKTFDGGGDPSGAFGGQTTTAMWNGGGTTGAGGPISDVDGYRFLNIPSLLPNPDPLNPKPGTLQSVYEPWAGRGHDGDFVSTGLHGFNSDTGSVNADGVYEFNSFNLQQGHTINVTGSKPLLIMCRGNMTIDGTITLDGNPGGPGFDDDGSSNYDPLNGSIAINGQGGTGVAGGGDGGDGAETRVGANPSGVVGEPGKTLWTDTGPTGAGGGGAVFNQEDVSGANDSSSGGGGGEFSGGALAGTTNRAPPVAFGAAGTPFGDMDFTRALSLFEPDRGYQSQSNITGGAGGGGGSIDDDNGASEAGNGGNANFGDDGGAGGGGGGGGLWVLCKGDLTIDNDAVITANGGAGGNTFSAASQDFDAVDGYLIGVLGGDPSIAGTGDGGPGGGGSGGALYFLAKGNITTVAGATLQALGGAGGTSGDAARTGGGGGSGRITFMTFDGGGVTTHNAGGTTSPTASIRDNVFFPTVDRASVGQSDWVDLFTSSAVYEPLAGGIPQLPTFNGNFTFPPDGTGFLQLAVPAGGGQAFGTDFEVAWEFQGANDLSPAPVPGMSPPTTADGLTTWYDVNDIDLINAKRYMRWRWRFWHKAGWGEQPGDPADLPLCTVYDLEIPFIK